ncbi:MAG: flavin reductase family protein [Anaerolineae bacterium]|nr:flavin reductase family protein [Anaerolineae bacterium]
MKLVAVDYVAEVADLMTQLAGPGLLLVTPDERRPANVMAIGWALFGRVWSQPICTVLVRPSRYTFGLINRAGVFTVNRMPPGYERAINRCGTVSGRDVDKIAEQGWTLARGETLDVPYIAEAALHLECRTVLTGEVTGRLDAQLLANCYPRGDLHTIYYGLVTGVFRHEG